MVGRYPNAEWKVSMSVVWKVSGGGKVVDGVEHEAAYSENTERADLNGTQKFCFDCAGRALNVALG